MLNINSFFFIELKRNIISIARRTKYIRNVSREKQNENGLFLIFSFFFPKSCKIFVGRCFTKKSVNRENIFLFGFSNIIIILASVTVYAGNIR